MINIQLKDLFKNSFVITIDENSYGFFEKIFNYHNLQIPQKYIGFQFNKFNKQYQVFNLECNLNSNILNYSYSHASIIKLSQYLDLPFVCIFEDNAYPCYDIKQKLEYYLTDIPDNCDCLVLGNNGVIKTKKYNNKFFKLLNYGYSAYAYIIFKNSYQKILDQYQNFSFINDHVFYKLNVYSPEYNLFIQYNKTENNNHYIRYMWKNRSQDQIFREFPPIEIIINSDIKLPKNSLINVSYFSNYNNYGQRLQSYAIQKYIKIVFDYDVYLIDHTLFFQNFGKSKCFEKFQNEKINIKKIYSFEELKILDGFTFIIGGDQCWNFNWDKYYYDSEILKKYCPNSKFFSYSSSEGDYFHHCLDEEKKKHIKNMVNLLGISFREKCSSEKFNEDLKSLNIENKKSTYNIDPVFLLEKEKWIEMSQKPIFVKENQIFDFKYFIGNKPNIVEEINGIKTYTYYGNNNNQDNIDPREFIWMIYNCRKFTTDSFHGLAFAIIFNKEFKLLKDDIRTQNIIKILNVKIENDKISNYDEVLDNINSEKKRAYEYFKDMFNKIEFKKSKYAAYYKDIELRNKSTSGGVSAALASQTISKGGAVYGASYSDDFRKVQTISVNNIDDYYSKIAGSKYNFCFLPKLKDVKTQLETGKQVLFTGCPCQIKALKTYLNREYDNLITVDLLCNGYSKPKYLEDFVDKIEKQHNSKIIKMCMRYKHQFGIYVEFQNGDIQVYENIITNVFVCNKANYLEKCLKCNMHTQENSYADITLGDFWDFIYKYKSNLPDDFNPRNGSSVVYINTIKGKNLFDKCKDQLIFKELSK